MQINMEPRAAEFCQNIARKPMYWLPLLILTFAAFGFDLFNRNPVADDTLRDFYNEAMLHSRWGMVLWNALFGVMDYSPFIDKFIALVFLILAGLGLSFILYEISDSRNVVGYSLFACSFITFPLINEIWNYGGANFYSTGGLLLCILSIIVLNNKETSFIKKNIIASLLLVLPVSSYESSVFSYLTIICAIDFYLVLSKKVRYSIKSWLNNIIRYVIPLIIAVFIRIAVSIILYFIFDINYFTTGDVSISWLQKGLVSSLIFMVGSDIYLYFVSALVYFPITEFAIAFIILFTISFAKTIKEHSMQPIMLCIVLILAVFSLSLLRGTGLAYRTAQTVSVFVAFAFFITYDYVLKEKSSIVKSIATTILFFVCIHQSTYLNKIQSLNNHIYVNEIAVIHNLAQRIKSNYAEKPIVFVSGYSMGSWIKSKTYADSTTWNGKLFYDICSLVPSIGSHDFAKYPRLNVRVLNQFPEIPERIFEYCGYNIKTISKRSVLEEATRIAKSHKMRSYEIYDNGSYLIVQLSGEYYFVDNL